MNGTILTLGGSGFIGTALSEALAAAGNEVVALTRSTTKPLRSTIKYVSGTFSSPADFAPLLSDCRTVVHLASNSTPGSSAGHPLHELEHNLRVTFALLEALQNASDCNLLYVSSGGTLYGDETVAPATESSKINPMSYHGAGKAAAEHFISAWAQQFSRSATILRPSNIYGPGQTAKQCFGIIPTTFAKIMKDEALEIWGDGKAVRDYLYIDDFIQLCLAIVDTPMICGTTILNAGSNTGTSLNELLSLIEDVTGRRIHRVQHAKRQVDASRVVIDSSEARRVHGWAPNTSLSEGLKRTWNWWATQP
jgi:UDP-glucose 4-epimerase